MKSKLQKREEAPEHLVAWRALTPAQQLASLDSRLGKGVGAKKQRTQLAKVLASVDNQAGVVLPAVREPLETIRPAIYDPEHYPEDREPQKPRKKFKKGKKPERHEP